MRPALKGWMMKETSMRSVRLLTALLSLLFVIAPIAAQDRFEKLPGYERYDTMRRNMRSLVSGGSVSQVIWREDGVQFRSGGEVQRYLFATGETITVPAEDQWKNEEAAPSGPRRPTRRAPRGRQLTEEPSPDGKWNAKYVNYNLELHPTDDNPDAKLVRVTTEGNENIKFATASWVYGEELDQNTAMWWSPDSTMIAFYEFDERGVKPYYLTPGFTDVENRLYVEHYPKAGAKNPIARVRLYHLASGKTVSIDVGDDEEQYIYDIEFSPNSDLLIFHRTNRRQNKLELCAADPATGDSRVIITETQDTWQENSPDRRWLADGKRFLWGSERTGWKHFEVWDTSGKRHAVLSEGSYPSGSLVEVDEDSGWVYFTAFSSDVKISQQLHRARLDGSKHEILTGDDLHYSDFDISPNDDFFIAQAESYRNPPVTYLFDMKQNRLALLADSDASKMTELGVTPAELFTFKADDGTTDLYGIVYFPSNFDSSKTYPLVIDVYGGPLSQGVRNTFSPVNPYTEFGFIVAKIDNRGTRGRGKAFEGATYLKLGEVDLKDQADGVRHLAQRAYIDGSRVGITGHSYGGYMAALGVMKHPEVFHVGVAGAPVTDWRNYDTIYTERFMWIPQENKEGYDNGACVTFVDRFTGKLLLLHGMVDDNVHPSNSFQVMHALQQARKPFDVMFYPNSGHGIGSPSFNPLKWEYLYDHLIGAHEPVKASPVSATSASGG